jgi:hypothetical protein
MTEAAIWSRVDQKGDCWLWTGYCDRNGYGRIDFRDRGPRFTRAAHVVIWELLNGPIPPGLELDHRPECPKRCVNPLHLEPVSHKTNMQRAYAYIEDCPKGHPLDGLRKNGRRYCRVCSVANVLAWRERTGRR